MSRRLEQIDLAAWDTRYRELQAAGLREPSYGGTLSRHLHDGDLRLKRILYDPSPEALRLWNFLLSEEDRLAAARERGGVLVGTMKDLGTVPVMAYALPNVTAFYPDGAWWIPCVMELSAGLLGIADSLGFDESFCPVRAMLGAFLTEAHFPIPDGLICSVGATCDDFSAIAQALNGLGYPVFWWEQPHRRPVLPGEETVSLPGGMAAAPDQVRFIGDELERVRHHLEELSGERLTDDRLRSGISAANRVRRVLAELRQLVYTSEICPLPALEMLIAEMLAIHFCSDRDESLRVLSGLRDLAKIRINNGEGFGDPAAARLFWVNPVADLTVMNLLEECGGRICGSEYLFTHALDEIPEDIDPMEALARTALADPMTGSAGQRAERICRDMQQFGSEGLIISKILGASHCALEGEVIGDIVRERLDLPVIEIEVPPVSDAFQPALRTRITGLIEVIKERRRT